MSGEELRRAALCLLAERNPPSKAAGVRELAAQWAAGRIELDCDATLAPLRSIPGIPELPVLVAPREVRQRSMASVEGRAALIHALVHIEFNAINLALDAIWRFAKMPREFYADWLQVACEEALHFELLNKQLLRMGYAYGDFPAHASLWEMADKTRDDVLARMALVPRTMEARGLDAVPSIRARFAQVHQMDVAGVLDIILRDEIGHVGIGNRWYAHLCAERNLEPLATYAHLAAIHRAPSLRGPFNLEARRAAGFSDRELAALTQDRPLQP